MPELLSNIPRNLAWVVQTVASQKLVCDRVLSVEDAAVNPEALTRSCPVELGHRAGTPVALARQPPRIEALSIATWAANTGSTEDYQRLSCLTDNCAVMRCAHPSVRPTLKEH